MGCEEKSLQQLTEEAADFDAAFGVCDDERMEEGSEDDIRALTKALELAQDIEQCGKVFNYAAASPDVRANALTKALEMAEDNYDIDLFDQFELDKEKEKDRVEAKALELAVSFADCMAVYDNAYSDDLKIKALSKALSMAETSEQCLEVWSEATEDSDLESQAFVAALMRAQSQDDIDAINGWENWNEEVVAKIEARAKELGIE